MFSLLLPLARRLAARSAEKSAIAETLAALREDEGASLSKVEALEPARRRRALWRISEICRARGAEEAERRTLERLIEEEASPVVLARLASIAQANDPRPSAALDYLRRAVAADPGDLMRVCQLADALSNADDSDAALSLLGEFPDDDPRIQLSRGRALYGSGKLTEALPLLVAAEDFYFRATRSLLGGKDLHTEARELRVAVEAELNGAESTVARSAQAGRLMGRSARNHTLLGLSLMAGVPTRARNVDVRPPSDELSDASARVASEPRDSDALVELGCARLRLGEIDRALSDFERAAEIDHSNYAAFLGLGAAMALDARPLASVLRELAAPASPPGIESVVRDLGVLTEDERQVVLLAVHPLRGALQTLAGSGARMKILPIAARVTDLPEFEGAEGNRHDDHRHYEAITGLASRKGIAVAKIESLLDVSENWTFAHEFAHLVHYVLPDEIQEEIDELYARAKSLDYVCSEYQLKNRYEFFAVSYVDFLHWLYGIDDPPLDEDGLLRALRDFFGRLNARETFHS